MTQRALFDHEPLPTLSLWNPWACLMAAGSKTIETRDWKTDYRGWLAIQAAIHFTNDEKEACIRLGAGLHVGGYDTIRKVQETCGFVICVVELYACELMTHDVIRKMWAEKDPELPFGLWESGRYAWRTRNLKRLDPPVRLKGYQKLFSWPEGRVICGL